MPKSKLTGLFITNGIYTLFLGIILIFSNIGDPAITANYNFERNQKLQFFETLFLYFSIFYLLLVFTISAILNFKKNRDWLFYITIIITSLHFIAVIFILYWFSFVRGFNIVCAAFCLIPLALDLLITGATVKARIDLLNDNNIVDMK